MGLGTRKLGDSITIEFSYKHETKARDLIIASTCNLEDRSFDTHRFLRIRSDIVPSALDTNLTNAPAIFIDLMNQMCKPYLDKFVIVFIEGILTYLRNEKEHEEHLKLILELLKKKELYTKFLKCEFWPSKMKCFGYAIDCEGIHVNHAKIDSI
nr:putative reverse transcriptase domain-containing protein [Tanacetum cinerariifolium]